jgi:hypothetical protein
MKQFNLELAKQGHPVCTREGRDYEIMSFDKLSTVYPITGRLKNDSQEYSHCKNGNYYITGGRHPLDLFMKDDEPETTKSMKITPETRVSELNKEEKHYVSYRLIKEYPNSPKLGTIIEKMPGTNMYFYNNRQICYPDIFPEFWVPVKEEKNFEWYVKEYHTKIHNGNSVSIIHNLLIENYSNTPFEIKIGLLKFICDDCNCSYTLIINSLTMKGTGFEFGGEGFSKVKSICPEEFLNSILQ